MNRQLWKTLAVLMLATLSNWALADPPGRVGRISETQGQVAFRSDYRDEAVPATLNWPVTSGNVIETAADARAEIRTGSAAVRIAAHSELEFTQLDERHFTLQLDDGSASVRIRNPEQVDDFVLLTPHGRVLLSEPSQIRVDVDGERSVVSVFSGAARFEGEQSNLPIRSGFRAEISGSAVRMSQLQPDAFDDWSLARDRRDESLTALRYVSPETTGYEELDQYGTWQTTADDGPVWYPRYVAADWAPYRLGRWAWIAPWGWTWIDNARWCYAPSHYGRWRKIGGRWGWLPGRLAPQPVWAPALVGWVGDNNWSVSFSFGNAAAVGWFPLAPREAYVPSYPASQTYMQQINRNQVTIIRQRPAEPHYQNRFVRDAVTVVPQQRFTSGRSIDVSREHKALAASGQWQHAPVSPTAPPAIVRRRPVPESAPAANVAPPRIELDRNRETRWQNRREEERSDGRQNERQDRPPRPALIMPPPRSTLQLQQQEQLQQLQRQQQEQQRQQREQEQQQFQQRQRQEQEQQHLQQRQRLELQRQQEQLQSQQRPVLPQAGPVPPSLRSDPHPDQPSRPPRRDRERERSVAPPAQPPVIMPSAPARERQPEREPRQPRIRPDGPARPPLPAPPALPAPPVQGHVVPQMPRREERRLQQTENAPAQQRDELLPDPARQGGRKLPQWHRNEER